MAENELGGQKRSSFFEIGRREQLDRGSSTLMPSLSGMFGQKKSMSIVGQSRAN